MKARNTCTQLFLLLFLFFSYTIHAQDATIRWSESYDDLKQLRNLPIIEVGRGVTFESKNKTFCLTLRARMQNLAEIDFDEDFKQTATDAEVKRIRLNFTGYVLSPKVLYSIQLGFAPNDTKSVPNGNTNIVRDAILYYKPNNAWNFGFGQTKVKANRAHINSSSALEFADRSIVDGQFHLDRDFGLFGEFYHELIAPLNMAAKVSVTTGEGRNWGGNNNDSGFDYTGRLELYPFGTFKGKGEIMEGDFEYEETPKLMIAGACSYNDQSSRVHGQNGAVIPDGDLRTLKTYYADMVFKYRGFAFITDFMGRTCSEPLFASHEDLFVFVGKGLNIQSSYMLPKHWSIGLRNSTLFADKEIRSSVGYKHFNQTTVGLTKYIAGHNIKVQTDASYNHQQSSLSPYSRWQFRLLLEVGI